MIHVHDSNTKLGTSETNSPDGIAALRVRVKVTSTKETMTPFQGNVYDVTFFGAWTLRAALPSGGSEVPEVPEGL